MISLDENVPRELMQTLDNGQTLQLNRAYRGMTTPRDQSLVIIFLETTTVFKSRI